MCEKLRLVIQSKRYLSTVTYAEVDSSTSRLWGVIAIHNWTRGSIELVIGQGRVVSDLNLMIWAL